MTGSTTAWNNPNMNQPATPSKGTHIWPQAAMLLGLCLSLAASAAHADDSKQRASRTPLIPTYTQECAACHIAYPPGMLPAASWQRLLANLPQHFGTDASMEPAKVAELTAWLTTRDNLGKRSSATPPPQDRITRSAWFLREHREVAASTWQRPAIKSPSNCAACHTRADQGDFDEHAVRIPR